MNEKEVSWAKRCPAKFCRMLWVCFLLIGIDYNRQYARSDSVTNQPLDDSRREQAHLIETSKVDTA
jgi:hypothetical protein